MLCMTRLMTAFGKMPEMSRKRPETVSPLLHFSNTQCTVNMSESTVDLPGLPPKELAGRRLWVLVRCTRSSEMIDDVKTRLTLNRF